MMSCEIGNNLIQEMMKQGEFSCLVDTSDAKEKTKYPYIVQWWCRKTDKMYEAGADTLLDALYSVLGQAESDPNPWVSEEQLKESAEKFKTVIYIPRSLYFPTHKEKRFSIPDGITIRPMIVGLGNPTDKHRGNRHNVGYMVVDSIVKSEDRRWMQLNGFDFTSEKLGDHWVMLVKPTTFMNDSGKPLTLLYERNMFEKENLIVIHDDLDMPLGNIRIKIGGSDGGHRGIRSISEEIGPKYIRVKLGIGRPAEGSSVMDHVLSDFLPDEQETLSEMIDRGRQAATMIVTNGVEAAQNRFNGG
jgi:peptidyl-tRNA hydrolase, PTH1 family